MNKKVKDAVKTIKEAEEKADKAKNDKEAYEALRDGLVMTLINFRRDLIDNDKKDEILN